jgi:hypothetical protein
MGSLSNLYISQSYTSLIHLGNDTTITTASVQLQDGLGNGIGVFVNSLGNVFLSGSLTSSLTNGYVWVGDANNRTTLVATSSFGGGSSINTGSFVTTSSFNAYTSSTNSSITQLNASSASQQISINALNSYTASNQPISTASFATTGSNTFVGANNFSSSVDILGALNIYDNNINIGYPKQMGDPFNTNIGIFTPFINASTGSLVLSGNTMANRGVTILNGLGITGSVVISPLPGMTPTGGNLDVYGTFSASLQQGYVWVGDSSGRTTTVATSSFGGGGTINTGSFATTGSNAFIGNQTVVGNVRVSGSNDNHIYINRPGGTDVLRLGVSDNGNTFDFRMTGSVNQDIWLIDNQGGTFGNAFFGFIQAEGRTIINAPFTGSQGAQINGGNLVIQSGSNGLVVHGNKQFNVGAFQSNITQSGSANVSQSMNFETTDISQGVTIVSNSRITLANSGTYNIQFSAQAIATGGADNLYIWLKKNGTNVTASAGNVEISNNAEIIAAWNYVVEAQANDYFELAWQAGNADTILLAANASGNIPSIPSIILTVTQAR